MFDQTGSTVQDMGSDKPQRRWSDFVSPLLVATGLALLAPSETHAGLIVYASSTFDGVIYRVDPSGAKSVLAAGLDQPHGLALDANGNVFVAEVGRDRITKITPNGIQSTFYQFERGFDNPEALAFDANGTLYASGTIGSPLVADTNYLYSFSPQGVATRYAPVGTQENLGIAIGPDGVIYVSDIALGGSIWAVRGPNDSVLFASGGFASWPWGLAFDDSGRLYFADALGGSISRFDDTTDPSMRSDYAQLSYPFSLAFDQGGRLFIGQETSISIITRGGSQHLLATGFNSVRGIAISYVPEPSSDALLGLGLVTTLLVLRRPRLETHAVRSRLAGKSS